MENSRRYNFYSLIYKCNFNFKLNFFLQHLASSGMYKFNGLSTVLDKDRVVNGSKDWMQKLVQIRVYININYFYKVN